MRKLLLSASLLILAFLPTTLDAQTTPGQVTAGPANNAGLLYASAFGQWQIPQGNSGLFSWTSPNLCNANANGIPLNPVFKVGTPIKIVDANPAMTEIVTPLTVKYGPLGCSIQVVTANNHYSFYITSATAGLQEAINWSAGLNYRVSVTPDWSRLGGQTSTITSATGFTNTTILDERNGGLCSYGWNGSAYVAQGCATDAISATLTSPQTMLSTLQSPGFIGPLTGHASLDLALTGGALSGPLNGNVINVGLLANYGDSLTSGNEGVIQQDTFPSLLQTFAGVQSINYGVGGTTSTQIAVRAGATASTIQQSSNSGVIPACTTPTCTPLTVAFPLGYEPTANSTTGGGGTVPVTGTIRTTPAIHGTTSLSLYQGTSTWSISGGTATINGLVLVAGTTVVPASGMAIEANGLTGATGCADLNGPHLLTGGTSSTASFSTSCTGSGTLGVVSIYTFTPDSYTAGATISGTPVWNTDTPCPSCNVVAWPGRNNLFTNGSYPAGLSVVQGSVNALAAIVPAGKSFVVMPVIPENISSEWSSGGNYSTLRAYQSWLASTYPNNYVDVWTALQNAGNSALPTDVQDIANGNIPTSLRAITATGTLHATILSTDTSMQVDVVNGVLVANQVLTLDVGVSTASENVVCSGLSGSSNPYSLTSCTRGFGGSTAFGHTGGAAINQDDATHLNQAGYAVVANAIATHLGITAGTSPATTPQLNRSITLGATDVQNHYIGGNVQGGLQLNFGTVGVLRNAIGTVNANSVIGSQFTAYNAAQSGGYAIDQWSQPLATNKSYMSLLSNSGWGVYAAPTSSSGGTFGTFWGSPLFTIGNTLTSNIQSIFAYNLNNFTNAHDSANTIVQQSGLTADQNEVWEYADKSNACLWELLKEGTFNSFRIFDCKSSHAIARLVETSDGSTIINAGFGANAIQLNATANSGTGGLLIDSGGASPATVGSIDGSGNALFSGNMSSAGVKVSTGVLMTGNQGIGTLLQHSTGSTTNNDCAKFNTNGDVVDAGAACGTGTGGVTSINSTAGAFTFSGAGVSCTGASCVFASVAPVNVTIPIQTALAATTCTGATTFTFTGATTSMGAWWSQMGDISGLTGYGSSNGILIDVWVSGTDQGSWKVCNVTAAPITTSAITVRMNAQ